MDTIPDGSASCSGAGPSAGPWRRVPDPLGVLGGFGGAAYRGVDISGESVVIAGVADFSPVAWVGRLDG